MCIAIYKPKGKIISRETLEICFANNADGAGFAVSDNGVLKMSKGFMSFEDFWASWEDWQELDSVIHFRIGTTGKKDAANCHPWAVDENTVIVHNGTLRDYVFKDCDQSDSGNFAQLFIGPLLEKLGPECFLDEWVHYLLDKVVGGGSKVIIFNKDAQFHIVNEQEGEWTDGIWFSNVSYKSLKSAPANNSDNSTPAKPSKKDRPNVQQVYVLYNDTEETPLSEKELQALCVLHGVSKAKKLKRKCIIKKVRKVFSETYIKYGGDGKHALETHWKHTATINPNK